MIPERFRAEADRLPAALRVLLDAELAAGNEIVEVASSFPAPPAGVYFMLAKPVSTRPRVSSNGVAFYHRNSSQYAGEFHDERRFFFILEAPLPPPPRARHGRDSSIARSCGAHERRRDARGDSSG